MKSVYEDDYEEDVPEGESHKDKDPDEDGYVPHISSGKELKPGSVRKDPKNPNRIWIALKKD